MSLTLNAAEARKADNFSSVIRDSGKYIGTITRAEKLLSKNSVEGLGLSFKTDDGASANYLDIYTVKPDGEKLFGYNTVQAILCCLRLKTIEEGNIHFEKWDKNERKMLMTPGNGYPAMMGKRIGLILQKEIQTHSVTGEDVERLNIAGVFEASTGLMSGEILDGKTKPERADVIAKMIAANPVWDRRKKQAPKKPAQDIQASPMTPAEDEFSDEIPF
jgi:hypothetical protein